MRDAGVAGVAADNGAGSGRIGPSKVRGDPRRGRTALGYAGAVVGVVLALLVAVALRAPAANAPLVLPFAAAVGAFVLGGAGPGVAALVLAIFGSELLLFDPRWAIAPTAAAAVRAVALLAAAVVVAIPVRAARDRKARAEQEASEAVSRAARAEEELRSDRERLSREVALQASKAADAGELAARLEELNDELVATNREVERAATRARRLQQTTGSLLGALTPAQVGDAIVAAGVDAVDGQTGLLALLSPDGKSIRTASAAGYAEEELERWRMLPLESRVPVAVAIRTGEAVWLPDMEEAGQRFPVALDGASRRTWAVLPLALRDRPIGALALGFSPTVSFTDDDRTFLALLAQQCAQAIDRARLYQAERGARVRAEFAERQLSFLAEASSRLAASLDYESTLASVARLIVPQLADWCTIHVLSHGRPRLVALVHRDDHGGALLRDIEARFPAYEGPATGLARALATGEPQLVPRIDDTQLRERARNDEHYRLLRQLRLGSEICVPIKLRDQVLGAVRIVSDGSGRRYTNTDLALAEELAARAAQAIDNARLYEDTRTASQAKSDFLGIMSHELRTPLNAILGYADLVLLGVPEPVGEQARHHIERVRTAAQHLLQLVDEVLSYARLESGKETARVEPVDVGGVVRESVGLIAPMAERKGLRVRTTAPDPPVQLATDGWKVRQILANLLSNAVKFTERGGIDIEAAADSDRVYIAVRDTGIGIPPEHLERIFEPFWQVEHSATRRFGGTGLGLGVARRLARLLGGDLIARSEPGSGSTFTLTLPLEGDPAMMGDGELQG